MASKRPLVLNAGIYELLQSGDTLDAGGYDFPNAAGNAGDILIMGANDAEWGLTTASVLTVGGVNTTGDIIIDSDASTVQLGDDADYTVGWDGGNAVHTISAGAYNFNGGAIRQYTVNTAVRNNIAPTVNGMTIYNTSTTQTEFYDNGAWVTHGGAGVDDLDDVADRGATTDQILVVGGINTTGDVIIDSDVSVLQLGEDYDYTVGWDGGNAVHTISAGSFNFEGGALKPVTVNTAQRDALPAVEGSMVYNSTTKSIEKYEDATWSAGQYALPVGGGAEDFLKREAGGYSWGTVFTSTLTIGAVNTVGNVTIDSDANGLVLGDDADYVIKHDGANATHTTSNGAFNFDGGAIRLPTFNTAQRDAIAPTVNGMTIYNSEDAQIQEYEAGAWEHKAPAEIITVNTTYYVKTSGNDTTGVGTNAAPWATIDKALEVAGGKVLLADLTIDVEKGDYADTDTLVFDHPQGGKLNILGDSFEETLALTSRAGASPAWIYTFNTANTAQYTVNDYVISYEATGGVNPYQLMGVLECTAINPGVSVSLRTNTIAGGASGAVTAKLIVPQVQWVRKLNFKGSCKLSGIQLQYDSFGFNYVVETLEPDEPATIYIENTALVETNASHLGQNRNTGVSHLTLNKCGVRGFFIAWAPEDTTFYSFETMWQSCDYMIYNIYGAVTHYRNNQFTHCVQTALNAWYESTVNKRSGTIRNFLNCTVQASPALDTIGNKNSYMGV